MSDVNDHFVLLQEKVRGRLAANDPAVPAPVAAAGAISFLNEQQTDFLDKFRTAIQSLGIAAIVMTPTALLADPESDDLGMYAPVIVQIQENTIINQGANGTKIPALRLVSFVMKRLRGWRHGLYGDSPADRPLKLHPKPFVIVRDENPITYNVAATAIIDLDAPLAP